MIRYYRQTFRGRIEASERYSPRPVVVTAADDPDTIVFRVAWFPIMDDAVRIITGTCRDHLVAAKIGENTNQHSSARAWIVTHDEAESELDRLMTGTFQIQAVFVTGDPTERLPDFDGEGDGA